MKTIALIAMAAALGLSAHTANAQVLDRKDLSLPLALAIAQDAIQACKMQGYDVSVHVIGRNGEVLVAMRGDKTGPHTMEASFKKAWTAGARRSPSAGFAAALRQNPSAGARSLSNLIPAGGGLPIKIGDETVGAVGLSGAPNGQRDEACAKAALDQVADQLR